jgi:rod shape-determining protein MreD
MGNYLSLPILALAAALQAGFLPHFSSGGLPDLVFLLVVAWALNTDLQDGVIWALVGGILLDLFSALPLGVSSIPLLVIVFVISGLGQRFFQLGGLVLFGVTLVGTLFQQLVLMLLLAVLGHQVNWLFDLVTFVLPTVLYNLILVVPIYALVRRVQVR